MRAEFSGRWNGGDDIDEDPPQWVERELTTGRSLPASSKEDEEDHEGGGGGGRSALTPTSTVVELDYARVPQQPGCSSPKSASTINENAVLRFRLVRVSSASTGSRLGEIHSESVGRGYGDTEIASAPGYLRTTPSIPKNISFEWIEQMISGAIRCKTVGFVFGRSSVALPNAPDGRIQRVLCVLPLLNFSKDSSNFGRPTKIRESWIEEQGLTLASPCEIACKFGFPLLGVGPLGASCGNSDAERLGCKLFIDASLEKRWLLVGAGRCYKEILVHSSFLVGRRDFSPQNKNDSHTTLTSVGDFAPLT